MKKLTHYHFALLLISFVAMSCRTEPKVVPVKDFYTTEFFKEVQMQAIFKDSKTFPDLVPVAPYEEIIAKYEMEKNNPDFDLAAFVSDNFSDQSTAVLSFETDTTRNMYEHISSIWKKLTRAADKVVPYSSRIPLPYAYVVPGGRFKEIYYWDSYFTLEGLLIDGQEELAKNMVANFSHLIDTLGFIPNGTRNYYLSRSQPPFFSLMVDAVGRTDSTALDTYFPSMLKEYAFWVQGKDSVPFESKSNRHWVRLRDTILLNRYWDKGRSPRPEAYKEDHHLASDLETQADKEALYANLRAGAESGWDFSSRWFAKEGEFASTKTSRIATVDLNCLLYFMEQKIAEVYARQGNVDSANKFFSLAEKRKAHVKDVFWDEEMMYFMDYNIDQEDHTGHLTLAGAFPLYFGIASDEQAMAVRDRLMSDFLKEGGLLTTLKDTGQQWDAPNGWAPLQWIAVHGLLNYGYKEEAKEIMTRWLALNEKVYKDTGKMMEKYNVEDLSLLSGGGEYETQDGFGWTNGVALAFKQLLETLKE